MGLIGELIEHTGLSSAEILKIIVTAPARYKIYDIPKRSGGKRTIAHPARELKIMQRYILTRKLSRFPVHISATAYTKDKNIYNNAIIHDKSEVILKLDFCDFFPSIRYTDFERFIGASVQSIIDKKELNLYSKILFWGGRPRNIKPKCLSIGAPSSPMISNILLFQLDATLSRNANDLNLKYTRYADDITVSGSSIDDLHKFESGARIYLKKLSYPNLMFNEDKRGLYTKGQRRMVTGLVLTPSGGISIGRERKRSISSMLHRSTLNQLDFAARGKLKGWLGFCLANEPQFIERMRQKYGDEVIDRALRFWAPRSRPFNGDLDIT